MACILLEQMLEHPPMPAFSPITLLAILHLGVRRSADVYDAMFHKPDNELDTPEPFDGTD